MVSRSALAVKKKPSSRNVLVRKSKVFQNRAPIVPMDRGTNSVLKRPSCATSSDLASSDWHEFTPQTINAQCCLARTWDDGYGGQCTRRALNDTATKLCTSHKRESNHPLGLTHGLVTGAIPARKLEQFRRLRALREAARQAARLEQSHSPDAARDQEAAVVAGDDDLATANIPPHFQDGQPRSVQCWRPKKIQPRCRPGTCVKDGKTFPKEFFEHLALQASNDAPHYLFQHDGYPAPLLGSIRCTLFGFERDLDGIRRNTICIYEWRFSHESIEGVEMTQRVKHKCLNLCYKRNVPRPPRRVRTAACVVHPSANICGVICDVFVLQLFVFPVVNSVAMCFASCVRGPGLQMPTVTESGIGVPSFR